jgi:hypothetical protein
MRSLRFLTGIWDSRLDSPLIQPAEGPLARTLGRSIPGSVFVSAGQFQVQYLIGGFMRRDH